MTNHTSQPFVGDGSCTVSVVIPTYNRADLICETIDSVLDQTVSGVEVIVIDDGSTDSTCELLNKRYGGRIRYLYQPNHGRAAARNRGVALSRGEYLLFLDSDDMLLPGGLGHEVAYLDAHQEIDVVYTDGYFCDRVGNEIGRIAAARAPHVAGDMLRYLVLSNTIMACHSAMVRRRALDRVGPPYFDESLHGTEDEDLWIRLAAAGSRFDYMDVLTCMYRVHATNASRFDPASPAFWERQKSVVRSRVKIMEADFFSQLDAGTRVDFFHDLLVFRFKGNEPAREVVLRSAQFEALEPAFRARLLYHLGLNNLVDEDECAAGQERLNRAAGLVPGNPRYRLVARLARRARPVIRAMFSMRRRQRQKAHDATTSPIGRHGLQMIAGTLPVANDQPEGQRSTSR
ncbi:MAG: glycosyltransferase [Anaerolineae bacterium]|nr:glycosyltransferase [Anaerolineae bacterium]